MEDAQIIALYWSRNPAAIEESSNKYGRALHRISFRILSCEEDSEECVSDTYYQAWTSIPPNRPGSLFAYLGRIVRNRSINLWHKNHKPMAFFSETGGPHPVCPALLVWGQHQRAGSRMPHLSQSDVGPTVPSPKKIKSSAGAGRDHPLTRKNRSIPRLKGGFHETIT